MKRDSCTAAPGGGMLRGTSISIHRVPLQVQICTLRVAFVSSEAPRRMVLRQAARRRKTNGGKKTCTISAINISINCYRSECYTVMIENPPFLGIRCTEQLSMAFYLHIFALIDI